jgi:hypothetical protein
MAKTETLIDDFSTQDNAKWDYSGSGGAAVSAGQLQNGGVVLPSIATYDLTNSFILVEVVSPPTTGFIGVTDSATTGPFFDFNALLFEFGAVTLDGAVGQDLGTYNPTTQKWLRIRESGGVVFWDASPDGLSWSTLHSASYAVSTSLPISLAGDGVLDNFNNPPAVAGNTSAFFVMF